MSNGSDRLTYLTVGEIREEIAYAVGADPGRFEAGSQHGIRRETLRRIAEQLRPDDSDLDVQACHLPELYETICEWVDVEYEHTAGNPWSLNKPQLKVIHRELNASDPREVPTIATDGGQPASGTEQLDRDGDECYWCGGDLAECGSIKAQMREDEPKRETCPDCFRDWPPEQVEEDYMDEESGDLDD